MSPCPPNLSRRLRRVTQILTCAALLTGCSSSRDRTVVIGSKNFTEQIILAELFAQQIEAHTALRVDRRVNLGGTLICHDALLAGKLDLYPEYTGTALTAILKANLQAGEQAAGVFQTVRAEYHSKFGVEVMPPLGFNNTFAIVVRGDDAEKLHLRTVSDIQPLAARWRVGVGYEFLERPDGYRGWAAAYALRFLGEPKILDLGLLYRALAEHQVDVVAGNSTDGVIAALKMVALEDDRHYFPPYEAVPLVREATLQKHPEMRAALSALSGKISGEEMRHLNYEVDGEHRDPAVVVRAFRHDKGL